MGKYPIPEQNYKVVIYCSTYNQREFIEDALKGFVKQKTNFPFCAVVIDDCSTDGQQDIILEYSNKYPDIIKPIFLTYNHYSKGLNKYHYLRPWIEHSKYVAQCEGDDYWLFDGKLQLQVDFMESHPECSLTYHACKNIFVDGFIGSKELFGESVVEKYTTKELFQNGYPFQTGTVLYRSSMWLSPFTTKALSILNYDKVLFLSASIHGCVLGINEQWSVYRRNNSGISKELNKGEKALMFFTKWTEIGDLCEKKTSKIIHQIVISQNLYQLSKSSLGDFLKSCRKELKYYPSVVYAVVRRVIRSRISHFVKRLKYRRNV